MIAPFDEEYKATKRIMLCKDIINPDFNVLSDWINQTFLARPVNIIYDTIDEGKRPRLQICFKTEDEEWAFRVKPGNFDEQKQKKVADKFIEIVIQQRMGKRKDMNTSFPQTMNAKYEIENVFVCFTSFERAAKYEANINIPESQIKDLKHQLNNNDLWEIHRNTLETTFLVFTDEQVKKYEVSETRKVWTDKYFNLLEPFNEFGYFKRDTFSILLDSKENFDNKYKSNWFFYDR